MHKNWRDCQAWRDEGLPMSTASNEACKLYDAALTQIIGMYNDSQRGLMSTINEMMNADPDFILGDCLKQGLVLLGSNYALNSEDSKKDVESLLKRANDASSKLNRREILHVKAIEQLQMGNVTNASDYWEEILLDYPTDMLAVNLSQFSYFYTGYGTKMRNSIARILPFWKPTTPLYSYLYGMYAFGLSQSNNLDQAEKMALKGLELNKFDGWSTHAMTHINEYSSNYKAGIKFLLDTESDWNFANMISGHNYWHLGLFYLENEEQEKTVDIIEQHFLKDATDIISASSLLVDLKMNNFQDSSYLEKSWKKLRDSLSYEKESHGYLYSGFHNAFVIGMSENQEDKDKFLNSLKTYLNSDDFKFSEEFSNLNIQTSSICKNIKHNYLKNVNNEIALDVFDAIFHFQQDEFEKVVDLLYPIRHELYKLGGSNAQRDIFNVILIYSSLNSPGFNHKKICKSLINERLGYKPGCSLVKRLIERFSFEDDTDPPNPKKPKF